MITVLWEDQRGGQVKTFGPHELLVACVADDLGKSRFLLRSEVIGVPKKGNGNVRKALVGDLDRLRQAGEVCAVFDHDQVLNLWPTNRRPPNCLTGIRAALSEDAPGDYEVVLLVDNIESVIKASCDALGEPIPNKKPSLNERDRILLRVASGSREVRQSVRTVVPSFARLVQWVARRVLQI